MKRGLMESGLRGFRVASVLCVKRFGHIIFYLKIIQARQRQIHTPSSLYLLNLYLHESPVVQ
jgi:hypothetical protein